MKKKEIIKLALPIIEELINDEILYGYDSEEISERSKRPVDEHSQVVELLDGLFYWLKNKDD